MSTSPIPSRAGTDELANEKPSVRSDTKPTLDTTQLTFEQGQIIDTMFYYNSEYCFPYRTFVAHTKLELPVVKEAVQSLKKLGYLYVARGLMTEDGEVAGSGFGIPTEKYREVAELYEAWDKRRVLKELKEKREKLVADIARIEAEIKAATPVNLNQESE